MPLESRTTPARNACEAEHVFTIPKILLARLSARARLARWPLAPETFAAALHRSAASRFHDAHPSAEELTRYLESLRLEDLALACACSEGLEPAWDFFMTEYREELYRAARAIVGGAGGEARARELADSLYAELYGLSESGAVRRSLFDYFHGRSKLSTWLRAVLAQRHVDAIRAERRTESLDETPDGDMRREWRSTRDGRAAGPLELDPDRARYLALLEAALGDSLSTLAPRDRLRLAYYYVHGRTLAEIGRIVGEHEASVSRHLDHARREVREQLLENLRKGRAGADGVATEGLSEAQVSLCLEYAMEDWPFDLSRALKLPPEGPGGSAAPPMKRPAEG